MSLHDEIEKIDEQLKEVTKTEGKADVKETKAADAPTGDESGGDDDSKLEKVASKASGEADRKRGAKKDDSVDEKEPKADAPADKEEEKIDNAAYAKLRRDQKAAEKRAKDAEDRYKALEERSRQVQQPAATTVKAAVDAEPDANLDPEAHLRWKLSKTEAQLNDIAKWKNEKDTKERNENLRGGAIKAYQEYEKTFAPTVKDYQKVTEFGVAQITNSIRTLNPQLQGSDLQEAVLRQVLRLAAQAEAQGHDPVENFYHTSKSWGYQEPKEEAKAEEEVKPSLKNIVQHKKKTAGALSHGGKNGNTPLSREALKTMGFADFAKLTPRDLKELEALEG